ncbi:uncharacterized protein L3040_001749 [Drepanopeziza brunnea f. sp. 'multigermtubi']|uniref:uncharacterized protein n=1 Tax=Drepanopeziza brunnea f. sp. 'multigermtubi' TaxID=698441 RepID=UPI002387BF3A|nr:hypothetical protein L3040_001749 [Drepanopeziza brunnea f. sp. 'multigermtubi']
MYGYCIGRLSIDEGKVQLLGDSKWIVSRGPKSCQRDILRRRHVWADFFRCSHFQDRSIFGRLFYWRATFGARKIGRFWLRWTAYLF